MLTRNAAKKQILSVDIDFDDASTQWRSNKRSIGNGSFQYICRKTLSSGSVNKPGRTCNRQACMYSSFCKIHKNNESDDL